MTVQEYEPMYFKVCTLAAWCSNREARPKPELAYTRRNGKKQCGLCLKPPCPEGAFYVIEGGDDASGELILRPAASRPWNPPGRRVALVRPNDRGRGARQGGAGRQLYRESGGGITLSGGECAIPTSAALPPRRISAGSTPPSRPLATSRGRYNCFRTWM